ncbi:hypothetical protein [Winogradskyella immobilis]|uniref:Uncharacterized protein n=1 Tax=Winogradskyella immobilis TaxID=2816852 RepID=A0ABS8EJ84_9FLAO|nr:hypothetical protein [Winogradskyella immobilis]MCC1483096.1 hypothetical protein [Winogradskyella immobilis]MCG0015191.1 hypothetical protein [Winogradskyella immobilis]
MKRKIITLTLASMAFYTCSETTEVTIEENLIIEELETIVEQEDQYKNNINVREIVEIVETIESNPLLEIKGSEVEIIEVIEYIIEKEESIVEIIEDVSNN